MIGNIQAVLCNDGTVNLVGKQGTTWELFLSLRNPDTSPMNIADCSFKGQIRTNYTSEEIVEEIDCSIISIEDGEIMISVSAENTSSIRACRDSIDINMLSRLRGDGVYVYDIEMIDAEDKVSRILEGKLYVDPEVTKEE